MPDVESQAGIVRLEVAAFTAAPAAANSIGAYLKATDSGLGYISRVVDGVPQWLLATDPLAAGPIGEP